MSALSRQGKEKMAPEQSGAIRYPQPHFAFRLSAVAHLGYVGHRPLADVLRREGLAVGLLRKVGAPLAHALALSHFLCVFVGAKIRNFHTRVKCFAKKISTIVGETSSHLAITCRSQSERGPIAKAESGCRPVALQLRPQMSATVGSRSDPAAINIEGVLWTRHPVPNGVYSGGRSAIRLGASKLASVGRASPERPPTKVRRIWGITTSSESDPGAGGPCPSGPEEYICNPDVHGPQGAGIPIGAWTDRGSARSSS